MQVSAKSDYALRALCVLATHQSHGCSVKAADLAAAQGVPRTFLDQILVDLRRAGIVESVRGPTGGHRLARPPYAVTVADVRALARPVLEHRLVRSFAAESRAVSVPEILARVLDAVSA